jgi:CrcB protein
MIYLTIAVGAALGANARYLVDGWLADRLGGTFPWGTLVINVSGSFAIGFLGSYTTFSTFSFETLALVESGSWFSAAGNVALSVLGALVGVYLGTVLGRAVGGIG